MPADADPWGEAHTFVHGIGDYYTALQVFEIDFSQFWRLGNIIDCRDRKPGRWGSWSNHSMSVGTPYETLYYDVMIRKKSTARLFTPNSGSPGTSAQTLLALGFYVGIPADVDSTGCTKSTS